MAPAAWEQGQEEGTLTRTAENRATFEAGDGEQVTLSDSDFVTLDCPLEGRP